MARHWSILEAAFLGLVVCSSSALVGQPPIVFADDQPDVVRGESCLSLPKRTAQKLAANQPVTIVCLGDSVTGIYYHTGGRRAYPEMLGLALKAEYPQVDVSVVNAGISGNSTVDGLRRLGKDVLAHQPDLVTVMFGLNDVVRVPISDFQANLGQIIDQCRSKGAEVLLCTPNSVIDTASRPIARLSEYCVAIKAVAEKHGVPFCDIYAAYEALRTRDPLAWRLLLSDEIHPNMDGHKLNAETLCRSITGRSVSLARTGPPQPAIPRTLALLKAGKPVRVLAMEPYDQRIAPALRAVVPAAQIEVSSWSIAGKTLAEIEEAAKTVRANPPDLVLVALPLAVLPEGSSPPETAIRSHTWVLNWALSFGVQQWDVIGIAPSVLVAELSPEQQGQNQFACRRILAQDLSVVARPDGNTASPEKILEDWLREQLAEKK